VCFAVGIADQLEPVCRLLFFSSGRVGRIETIGERSKDDVRREHGSGQNQSLKGIAQTGYGPDGGRTPDRGRGVQSSNAACVLKDNARAKEPDSRTMKPHMTKAAAPAATNALVRVPAIR
jgi:hypothetical protein